MVFPLRVSIDNHMLQAVASDGYDFQPRNFESIIINPGERFDFIITANQTVGDYWIRADSMAVSKATIILILYFALPEPTTSHSYPTTYIYPTCYVQ